MRRRVLVTGANGFIGRHLCAELLPACWLVRAAVRRPEAVTQLPQGVEPCLIPSVGASTDWSAALDAVDAVVHLAGRAHVTREDATDPLEAYRAVNVEGTRRLTEESARAGVRRFLFLSSVKAIGEGGPTVYTEEETACRPEDGYGISKLEAERTISEVSTRTGLETVIIRPPLVYGPGVRANFLRLFKLVERGLPLPFGSVNNIRSMIFVGNLVAAILLCLEHPAAAGETFLVADREAVSTRELVLRIGGLMKRPVRLLAVPVPLLRLAGRLTGRSDEVDRLVGSLMVSSNKIHTTLGWEPAYTLDHGLHETVASFGPRPKG